MLIKNLKKEIKIENKIKVGEDFPTFTITDKPDRVVSKLLKYFSLDDSAIDIDMNGLEKTINSKLKNYSVKFSEVPHGLHKKMTYSFVGKKSREAALKHYGVRIELFKGENKVHKRNIYTIPFVKFSSKASKNLYLGIEDAYSPHYGDGKFKFLDFNYFISSVILIDNIEEYLKKDTSILSSESNMSKEDLDSGILEKQLKSFYDFRAEFRYEMSLLCYEYAMSMAYYRNSLAYKKKYKKTVSESYARSFETKQRIPDTHKRVMESTKFREIFKFVELDESTDLSKFSMIEKEFQKLSKVLNLKDLVSNAELRFRLLGQHKALGLYYPDFRCVCVDVRSPSSFLHEIFHHIDFANGELSWSHSFKNVANEYISCIESRLETLSDNEVASFKRKKSYYYTPTEIFARCGEIYLAKIMGLKTSFLKELSSIENNIVYPLDEVLLEKISSFFKDIIELEHGIDTTVSNSIMEDTIQPKVKKNITESYIPLGSDYVQLTLF